ncbi:copper ion binding protein [Helicobacter fennelliae]|uniref:Copper iron binding protein n=2 Tax=Helicobacter fennelliae TaxID=215 RepID=T1CQZ7_9HELI|nr:copper ion binding protein [Helicobacter fennelliae]GAD19174.1 copper iron binding protein [Helicobacter fennelliae MRY12-0050]SQB98966.1 COP-associated protein (Copper ion-binding protein) [Helicobacter fennelliae]STP08248.1 COP-associated protein (Copper ion-binding protein) [Helicobacter fennelliae]STQ84658.1 COP-associated protein (Copper ion-binding protein) [Helicobacter fennelliae]
MKETLKVNGMNCAHCENKIKTFVNELKGVKNTEVSLSTKEVSVEFESPATLEQIKEAILDSGFEVC